jgi:hypothetical protein
MPPGGSSSAVGETELRLWEVVGSYLTQPRPFPRDEEELRQLLGPQEVLLTECISRRSRQKVRRRRGSRRPVRRRLAWLGQGGCTICGCVDTVCQPFARGVRGGWVRVFLGGERGAVSAGAWVCISRWCLDSKSTQKKMQALKARRGRISHNPGPFHEMRRSCRQEVRLDGVDRKYGGDVGRADGWVGGIFFGEAPTKKRRKLKIAGRFESSL